MRTRLSLVVAVVLGLAATIPVTATAAGAPRPLVGMTAEAMHAPWRVPGDDGRDHLAYQLQVTNLMAVPAVLTAVSVRDQDGKQLQALAGQDLAMRTQTLGTIGALSEIPSGASAVVVMDVPISPDRQVASIRTSVGYYVAPGYEVPAVVHQIGLNWTTVSPPAAISTTPLPVLAPPVAGTDWLNNNQFGDPTTGHSGARMTKGGRLHANEAFAIDFIRFVDGSSHSGDGTANSDYFAYGARILSATTGVVVSVRDGMIDEPPGQYANDLTSIDDAGGNSVMVKAADGVYVYYAHLQPGSIRVKPGDSVRVGQRLGLLGNSGNTTGPHLHFQVSDGPDVMRSDSIPYVFSSFTQTATITLDAAGEPTLTLKKRTFTNVYPTTLGILTFP